MPSSLFCRIVSLLFISLLCSFAGAQTPGPKTLMFSGYEWVVRSTGKGGPGPNEWSPENVWLDKDGQLHLKINRVTVPATATQPEHTEWRCAELNTKEKFGYGKYAFEVIGWIDRFEANTVLGLFDYPGEGDGSDGTNEIDIEFAHWGNPQTPNGNYTVYPASGATEPNNSHTFRFSFKDAKTPPLTTHRFQREIDGVDWEFLMGDSKSSAKPLFSWHYQAISNRSVPQKRLPVHINLWLFHGHPPTDGKEVEIVIKKFTFTPAGA